MLLVIFKYVAMDVKQGIPYSDSFKMFQNHSPEWHNCVYTLAQILRI